MAWDMVQMGLLGESDRNKFMSSRMAETNRLAKEAAAAVERSNSARQSLQHHACSVRDTLVFLCRWGVCCHNGHPSVNSATRSSSPFSVRQIPHRHTQRERVVGVPDGVHADVTQEAWVWLEALRSSANDLLSADDPQRLGVDFQRLNVVVTGKQTDVSVMLDMLRLALGPYATPTTTTTTRAPTNRPQRRSDGFLANRYRMSGPRLQSVSHAVFDEVNTRQPGVFLAQDVMHRCAQLAQTETNMTQRMVGGVPVVYTAAQIVPGSQFTDIVRRFVNQIDNHNHDEERPEKRSRLLIQDVPAAPRAASPPAGVQLIQDETDDTAVFIFLDPKVKSLDVCALFAPDETADDLDMPRPKLLLQRPPATTSAAVHPTGATHLGVQRPACPHRQLGPRALVLHRRAGPDGGHGAEPSTRQGGALQVAPPVRHAGRVGEGATTGTPDGGAFLV